VLGDWYDEDAIRVVSVGRGCSLVDGRHFLVLSVELWLEAIVVQFALRRVPGSYDESLPIAVVSLEDDTGYRYAGLEPAADDVEALPLAMEPGAVTRLSREFAPAIRPEITTLYVKPEGGPTIPVDLY
jgi:hypothetical protein